MFLFLFLSLGQLFASQQLANEVYFCVDRMARDPKSSNYTIQEVAEACSEIAGQNKIQVIEARRDEGSTHIIRLSDGTTPYFFAWNILGSVCKDNLRSSSGAVNNSILNVQAILDLSGNSKSANSCRETAADGDIGTTEIKKPNFLRFGFKKNRGKCERTCPPGQFLEGTRSPFVFSDSSLGVHGLLAHTPGQIQTMDEQYINVQCIRCPSNEDPKYSSYTRTKPDSNSCYDSHGCPEGMVYFPNNTESANRRKFKSILYGEDIPAHCTQACHNNEVMTAEGCKEDESKSCEELRKMKDRANNIGNRFRTASQNSRIGTCDMNQMRQRMTDWVSKVNRSISNSLKGNCKESEMFRLGDTSFLEFLTRNTLKGKNEVPCFSTQESARNLDAALYGLLRENIRGD